MMTTCISKGRYWYQLFFYAIFLYGQTVVAQDGTCDPDINVTRSVDSNGVKTFDISTSLGAFEFVDDVLEKVTETIVIKPSGVEYITCPAKYVMQAETITIMPARVEYETLPAIYSETGEVKTAAKIIARIRPAVTEERERRVIAAPCGTVEKLIPAIIKKRTRNLIKKPAYILIREKDGNVIRRFRLDELRSSDFELCFKL
ncbi:MAG: hypothetical protein ACPGVT_03395 [Maricaulaceae bacterium]